MLQLGQQTFTHNTAGLPFIVACTTEDSIHGLVGGEESLGWVGMVKGCFFRCCARAHPHCGLATTAQRQGVHAPMPREKGLMWRSSSTRQA